jgi:hypothetical protein
MEIKVPIKSNLDDYLKKVENVKVLSKQLEKAIRELNKCEIVFNLLEPQ